MTDPIANLDAEAAALDRLRAELADAIAARQAEHDAGRIGYEAYRVASAKHEQVMTAAAALQRRLAQALDTLTRVAKGEGQ